MIVKRLCPECKSDRVIGFTHEGTYSMNCLTCKHVEQFSNQEDAMAAWYPKEKSNEV